MKIATAVAFVVPTTAIAALATRKPSGRRLSGLGEGKPRDWEQQSFSLFRKPVGSKKKTKRAKAPQAKRASKAEASAASLGPEEQCLVLGKDHPRYRFGPYEVCLTKNQRKKLFKDGIVGLRLGCGVFACAFETNDPDKVVKITRDPEDVAALIKAQKTDVVPRLYAAYTLGSDPAGKGHSTKTGEQTPAYALVVERLRTLDEDDVDNYSSDIFGAVNDYLSGDMDLDEVEANYNDLGFQAAQAAGKLKKATGIKWTDAHGGNIGFDKNGNLKILDLGITKTALKRKPRILEGAAAARLREQLAGIVRRAL